MQIEEKYIDELYHKYLANLKQNRELEKEVKALRRALVSHGEICELNHNLQKKVKLMEEKLSITERLKIEKDLRDE